MGGFAIFQAYEMGKTCAIYGLFCRILGKQMGRTGNKGECNMAIKKTDSTASLALIALSCILHVVIFRGKVDMNHSVIYRILSAVLAVVIVLPIHELIHWISMRFFGRKDARIEIARDPLGLPSLRTIASGKIENWKNNIILLAPFFLLTVIPDVIFLYSDRIAFVLFIAAVGNSAGCCFDLLAVLRRR